MLLTEYQPTSGAPEAGLPGRIHLRVRSQAEDYFVDLPGGKTTIGSSPRCTVRIQQPGVHPLHCLVVHEKGGLNVRRWAADTLLNGEPFDDAPLAVGDHLSLGPVDLEVVGEDGGGERGDEFLDENVVDAGDIATTAQSFEEPVTPYVPFSWGKDTIHHTTVWIGEEEGEASPAPSEHVEAELEEQDERADATRVDDVPADVVPAEAAREVFRQLQTANAVSRSRSRKLLNALRKNRDAYRALSARVDELATAKTELAAEHDTLARELPMLRKQLATAHERYAEWDHQANEWEMQRAAWETNRAAWEVERAEWDRQRAEWNRQVGEWESRLADHVQRIAELETKLSETCAAEADPMHAAAEPFASNASTTASASDEPAQESAAEPAATGQYDWTTQSAASQTLPTATEAEFSPPAQTAPSDAATTSTHELGDDLSQFAEFSMWKQGAGEHPSAGTGDAETAEAQIPAWESETPAEPPTWERHTPAWESEVPAWEDRGPAPEGEAPIEPIRPETDSASAAPQPADPPAADAAPAIVANPSQSQEAEEAESPAPSERRQSVSYIERFAHMFQDEDAGGHSAPPSTPAASGIDAGVGKPRNTPVIRREGSPPPVVETADEESLEQYMAKLMQRVRGDKPYVPASQTSATSSAPPSSTPPAGTPAAAIDPHVASQSAASPTTAAPAADAKHDEELATDLSELVRHGPIPQRPENLDALRALANETARHAIGIHATKKHRRDAVTKFIVASLAGMTSLWLMLLAPNWRDVQFISAGVSLLIAVYWAAQTYRTLLDLSRAGGHDGPNYDFHDDLDDLNPPLPIDVERR